MNKLASCYHELMLKNPAVFKQALFTAGLIFLTLPAQAREPLSLGLGQDNLNITWPVKKHWAIQSRLGLMPTTSTGAGVIYIGTGLRRYFKGSPNVKYYMMPDFNLSYFDIDQAQGAGIAAGLAAGFEYRLSRQLGFSADAGPYGVYLLNYQPYMSHEDVVFIINTSIHWYLGTVRE